MTKSFEIYTAEKQDEVCLYVFLEVELEALIRIHRNICSVLRYRVPPDKTITLLPEGL